jgi:hypothetical protein
MAISLTCLAVAADVSSACSVLQSYLPACQIRPWHTEEQDAGRLAGREASEFSTEIVTGGKNWDHFKELVTACVGDVDVRLKSNRTTAHVSFTTSGSEVK